MPTIQDYRKDAILDKQIRYAEGVMTRRAWLHMQHSQGATVNEGTKAQVQYNRTKFNRMTSDKEQDEYLEKCNARVLCYELHRPGERAFWEITKTEYDYFNSL